MKLRNILAGLLFVGVTASFASCSTTVSTRRTTTSSSRSLPPGQAKKLNGDRSAHSYAPGHNKGR